MFMPKSGMSHVWKGITENSKFLCEGLQVHVGNDRSTLFWDHRWATPQPLIDLASVPVPNEILGYTVEEMWEVGQGWKWDVFGPYLNQDVLRRIQSFALEEDSEAGDLLYWRDGAKGKFTIKSALSIMWNEDDLIDDSCWNLVWRAPVQQRVQAFCGLYVMIECWVMRRGLNAI